MPLAFPSHQGLILPLWRRFPRHIDALGLCVGAAMPDVVDGLAWPLRGELGQWLGHSLLGVVIAATPLGVLATVLLRRRLPRAWLARLGEGHGFATRWRVLWSVALGALSHVAFDLPTHAGCKLLWPWYVNDDLFPDWWCHRWAEIPLLVYREPYPLAPHTLSWLVLTLLGAWLFMRCLWPRQKEAAGDAAGTARSS
jgi:hypothetical protein